MPDHIYTRNEEAMCYDCGHDTQMMYEYYMLHNDIWRFVTKDTPHLCFFMLCICCAEKRLGRRFHKFDFSMAPINYDKNVPKSLLLRHRLNRIPTQDELMSI